MGRRRRAHRGSLRPRSGTGGLKSWTHPDPSQAGSLSSTSSASMASTAGPAALVEQMYLGESEPLTNVVVEVVSL
jgi:hypothetical protein